MKSPGAVASLKLLHRDRSFDSITTILYFLSKLFLCSFSEDSQVELIERGLLVVFDVFEIFFELLEMFCNLSKIKIFLCHS